MLSQLRGFMAMTNHPREETVTTEIALSVHWDFVERRRKPRGKCRCLARIMTEGEVFSECLITDISDTGARLTLKADEKLPKTFFLMADEFLFTAQLVWRNGNQVGVKLIQTR